MAFTLGSIVLIPVRGRLGRGAVRGRGRKEEWVGVGWDGGWVQIGGGGEVGRRWKWLVLIKVR